MGHPALRPPGWQRPFRLAQNIKFVRRGGIYPARDVRAAAVRADMESAPTRVCNAAWLWFFVWPCAVPPVVGADSISARGPLRRCEVPGPPPRFPRLRRAGVHARRTLAIQNWNVCAAAGSGGMGHPALRPPGWRRPSRLAQNIKFVRRGGIYCARRRVSEANRRAAAALRPEIPPGTFAPPRGSRDDASIVPYTGLQCRRVVVSRLDGDRAAGRRGGIYPARGVRAAASRADIESAPTGVRYNKGNAVSRLAAGLAPPQTGPIPPRPYFSFFNR